MNTWKVIAYDGLLHLGNCLILAILLLILVRVIGRKKIGVALFSAIFAIFFIHISSSILRSKTGGLLPANLSMLGTGITALLTACLACILIKWRFKSSFFASGISAVLITVAHFYSSSFVPVLSKQLMPDGPRFTDIGAHTKSEIKRIVDEAIQKEAETGTPSLIAKLGKSYSGFKQITSEEESAGIGRDFKAGMDFIKERRALMASMTEEDKASYRQAVSDFKGEQGISNDPYSAESLARLKNVKGMEGIGANLQAVAQLKGSGNLDMAGMDQLMGDLTVGLTNSGMESKAGGQTNHAGNANFAQLGKLAQPLGKASKTLGPGKIDFSGLNRGTTTPSASGAQRPAHQNFMVKDNQPELNYFAPASDEASGRDALTGGAMATPSGIKPTEIADLPAEIPVPKGPVIEFLDPDTLIPAITEKAIFRIPEGQKAWDEWFAVAKTLKVEGFFIGEGTETTTIVIINHKGVTVGENCEAEKNGRTYTFRIDPINDGVIRLSAVSRR